VQSCPVCHTEVETYLQLFSAIRNQPKPAFDFDLSRLVLQQLPAEEQGFSLNNSFIFLVGAFAIAAIAVPAFLFRKFLTNLFAGILPMTMGLLLLIVIAILLFQATEIYRKYQKQINAIN
jgi:hypothetical protein